jgi:hypothetical protein
MAVPPSELGGAPDAMEISQRYGDHEHLVGTASRNGALFELLKQLWR